MANEGGETEREYYESRKIPTYPTFKPELINGKWCLRMELLGSFAWVETPYTETQVKALAESCMADMIY